MPVSVATVLRQRPFMLFYQKENGTTLILSLFQTCNYLNNLVQAHNYVDKISEAHLVERKMRKTHDGYADSNHSTNGSQ